jgi:dTMP kinase
LAAFIVLEGGEGVGKTTQSQRLHRLLVENGYRALPTHEPGGTPLGEELRQRVKRADGLDPQAELFLILAARAHLVSQVVRPALERGEVVICDRFAPSTLAYQGWGRGLDTELLGTLNELATSGLSPDLVVLLDAPEGVGLGRKPDEGKDNFESEPSDFHKRVREGYLSLARQEPERWLVVDATLPPDRVEEIIWERVSALLQERS